MKRSAPVSRLVPIISVYVVIAFGLGWTSPGWAAGPQHGMALGTALKYPPGFAHFAYADPKAVKGGVLSMATVGGFDKLNPFSLKGREPLLLQSLVFDTLMTHSLEEPFTLYGLLAETVELAEDGLSVTYRLNPKARFADGQPVTADDVVFSFTLLRSEVADPHYRAYYKDVANVVAVDKLTVRIEFARRNRELAMITAEIPILPKHFYGNKDFEKDFLTVILGSGPYVVKEFDFGKSIRYERYKDYWGRDLNANVGKYNFDAIVVKYYKSDDVRVEGFKAGDFDYLAVSSSKQWARDIGGEKWDKGYIIKQTFEHRNVAGIQGFLFNTRRPLFHNREVRHALAFALDFAWMNATLFFDQYTANASFFDNSELAATGLPTPAELALLEPHKAQVPAAVFTEPLSPLGKPFADERERLRAAQRLLKGAGWEVRDGVLTETATGRPLQFTITLDDPSWQRIAEPYLANLGKLGVKADMKVVDDAVYEGLVRTHDFDMLVGGFGQSQSPGNEQRDYWHSEAADREGSRNLIGIKNPAVDALVEAIIKAASREELMTATRALDRVLWHEHYVVPHWYIAYHRVTYWNKLAFPATLPLYYNPLSHLMYWWLAPDKDKALKEAMATNQPLKR